LITCFINLLLWFINLSKMDLDQINRHSLFLSIIPLKILKNNKYPLLSCVITLFLLNIIVAHFFWELRGKLTSKNYIFYESLIHNSKSSWLRLQLVIIVVASRNLHIRWYLSLPSSSFYLYLEWGAQGNYVIGFYIGGKVLVGSRTWSNCRVQLYVMIVCKL